MNISWDAKEYGRKFSYVSEYGKGLIELLEAPPGAAVLDLGCGNGSLTAKLQGLGYRASGMDSSPEQINEARRLHPGLPFFIADAADFQLPERVDAIFSNAVFHWIDADKQPAMLRCIARALKPGGRLVCEFGGRGNTAAIHQALRDAFAQRGLGYAMPFFFPTIGEYAPLAEAAGLQALYAGLFSRPTALQGEHGIGDWIRMFVRSPFLGMQEEEKNRIIAEAEASLRPALYRNGTWHADYVRLRLVAAKG